MKNRKKIKALRQFLQRCLYMILIFWGLAIMAIACDKDPEMPEEDAQQQEDPDVQDDPDDEEPQDSVPDSTSELDPDLLSEKLVLNNAAPMVGDLPTATDGQVKVDVQDTVFLVKGYPLGNRLIFRHDTNMDITGFYVKLEGASTYYDVPEDYVEDNYTPNFDDQAGNEWSTSVFTLDLDLTGLEEIVYPFHTEITIQPHDPSGISTDETTKVITIEDPENTSSEGICNTITEPLSNNQIHWEWDFTIYEYNGDVLNVFAPGLAQRINTEAFGCCNTSTQQSYTEASSPTCNALVSDPNTNSSGLMVEVNLEVDDYSVRTFELWQIYEDGSLNVFGNEVKKQFDISITNFCDEIAGYTFDNTDTGGGGSHDFIPGANRINFNFPNWDGSWRPSGGELVYTCHTMIITRGGEGNLSSVYRKVVYNPYPDHNPVEFYTQWKPWFD